VVSNHEQDVDHTPSPFLHALNDRRPPHLPPLNLRQISDGPVHCAVSCLAGSQELMPDPTRERWTSPSLSSCLPSHRQLPITSGLPDNRVRSIFCQGQRRPPSRQRLEGAHDEPRHHDLNVE
jgi:hypothetical protein